MKSIVLVSALALAVGLSGCMTTTTPGGVTTVTVSPGVQVALNDIQTAINALPAVCSAAATASALTAGELAIIQSVTKLAPKTVSNINNALSKGVVACNGTSAVLLPLATLGK